MVIAWLWGLDRCLFAASIAAVVLIWIGYPVLLWLWSRLRPQTIELSEPGEWPFLSVILTAYNEAGHIRARLQDLLQQDYPADRLEIIVAADESGDGTTEIVSAEFPGVHLLTSSTRQGKAAAMNRAAAVARGEVLIFTDANNAYSPSTLRHLVTPFGDCSVGAVTGCKTVKLGFGVGGGESFYWRYESRLITWETTCGSAVAGFGEVLAVRRCCFVPIPVCRMVNDDLHLVLQVLAQRLHVVAVPEARSSELPSESAIVEWERRNRMMVGRWYALRELKGHWSCVSFGNRVKILFHQVLRPLSAIPFFVASIAGAPLAMASAHSPMTGLGWRTAAWLPIAGLAWTSLVAASHKLGVRWGRLEAPYFFCLALAATMGGFWRYLQNRQSPLWHKSQRASKPIAETTDARVGFESPVLTGHIVAGLFWASSSFLVGKILVFASVMVLARLLAPQEFGLVALAVSTVTVLEIFATLGLTSALIYEEVDVDMAAQVCFWSTTAAALVELVLAGLLAPQLGTFFHDANVAPMLRWLLISLIFTTLGNTHDTLLRRGMAFRRKLIPDLGMAAAKGGIGVLLAWMGFGAWSLIWGQVIGSLCSTILLWQLTPWRPRIAWSSSVAHRLFKYAKHIYLLDGSSVLLTNLDTLTIGRMLSAAVLGFYTMAFRVPEVMLLSVLNVITRVVFPAFSRIQSDLRALRIALLETSRYTTLFTLPLAAGMIVLAREFVLEFYGATWKPAIPVLRVLTLYGGIRCVAHHFGDAYKAIGRPDVLSRVTALWWLLLPVSLAAGAKWDGIEGVAWGQVATRLAMTVFHFVLVIRILKIRLRQLWMCFAPAIEGTAFMTLVLAILHPWFTGVPPRQALAILIPLAACTYAGFLQLRFPEVMRVALEQLIALPQAAAIAPPQSAAPAIVAAPKV